MRKPRFIHRVLLLVALAASFCPRTVARNHDPKEFHLLRAALAAHRPVVLNHIAQLRVLTPEQANQHLPVRVRAVVTFFDDHVFVPPTLPDLFIQDSSAGIWVRVLPSAAVPLKVGDLVEVQGVSEVTDFAPQIRAEDIRVVGTGPLPKPIMASPDVLTSAVLDAQWITVRGVVRNQVLGSDGVQMKLDTGAVQLTLYLLNASRQHLPQLVDAEITARGACGSVFNSRRQRIATQLRVPSLEFIHIDVPPPSDPFSAPSEPIASLLGFAPNQAGRHRLHVQGIVTLQKAAKGIFIQDNTAGLDVSAAVVPPLQVGDHVDVVGFAMPGSYSPVFEDAVIRRIGAGQPVAPRKVSPDQVLTGDYDSEVIRTTGRLLRVETRPTSGVDILELQSGPQIFTAGLETPSSEQKSSERNWKRLRAGSVLELNGVCLVGVDEDHVPRSFSLLLRSKNDVRVLIAPPLWSLIPLRWIMLALGAAILVAMVWIAVLKRTIGEQSHTIIKEAQNKAALEEQLRHSQKLEAVGRLAGGIAHDFNNLLTVISGRTELLMKRHSGDLQLLQSLEPVRKAAERASGLTRQLLAYSRRQMLQPKRLDLNAIVQNVCDMLRRLIGEDVELVVLYDRELGPIFADETQLEQVLMNLTVNARDAMPDGGKLIIETKNVDLDEVYAHQHADVAPGAYVMLAVSDTGTGMDAQTKARIFEPFFTTKEVGKGTGLGLATVYGIVKQSGGNIWVYSEPGHGTTFKIYLPRHEQPQPEVAEAAPVEAATGGSEVILLVEDETDVRSFTREVLEIAGYRVLEAANGRDALSLARRQKNTIHLLLTDAVMPELNGRELAKGIAPLHPETAVLFMSGYTDRAIVHQNVIDSEIHFLQKPFTPETLIRKVREVLDVQKVVAGPR